MITIIHGDDVVSSRKYLLEQKQMAHNPFVFDQQVNLEDIIQITQGKGLFSSEKKIFIENYFSKNNLNSSATKDLINYINKNESLLDVSFWEGKELQKNPLKLFNKPTIKIFKIPKTIFSFLDNIKPGNYKNSITLFHRTLETTEAELIFYMLQRQLRILLSVAGKKAETASEAAEKTIEEASRLAPWQKAKLERQAKLFSIDTLLETYKKLYKIELKHKTGSLPYSLDSAIDFLLLSI